MLKNTNPPQRIDDSASCARAPDAEMNARMGGASVQAATDIDKSAGVDEVCSDCSAECPTIAGRELRYGGFELETAREAAAELRTAREAEAKELSLLSSLERQARRQSNLRSSVADDSEHVRRLYADAERRAQSAHSRARAATVGAHHYITRSARRERRAGSGKRVSAGTAGDADPAPALRWKAKSKSEQTVIVVKTRNPKLGKGVWASTLPVHQTCPNTCPLLDNGCYGQRGPGGHVKRLEANAKRLGMTAIYLAHEEAGLIRRAALRRAPGTPLRLHSSGDSRTRETAQTVSAACKDWPGPVFSYTHAWRTVAREAWGRVSILASMERPEDAARAMKRGYAPCLEVEEHPADGRAWRAAGVKWIPCPNQTRKAVTCTDCRLCFDADELRRRGCGITLAAHGSGANRVRAQLVQLRKKGGVS